MAFGGHDRLAPGGPGCLGRLGGLGHPGDRRAADGAVGGGPVEFGQERGRPGAVGEQDHPVAGPGDPHVEDPALFFHVVGQAVGNDPVDHSEQDDAVPFSSLDPVDRGQRDPAGGGGAGEHLAQPRFEPRGIGVEVGHRQQPVDVVEVAGALGAAGAVEHGHGRAEPDLVAHRLEDRTGGAPSC